MLLKFINLNLANIVKKGEKIRKGLKERERDRERERERVRERKRKKERERERE